jgi:hypothetical protein
MQHVRCVHPAGRLSLVTEVPLRSLTAIYASIMALALPALARAVPSDWHPAGSWLGQALCVHSREGAWNAATGNGFEGGLQFLRATWTSVGGSVDYKGRWASVVSPREQLYRAWLVWRRDGGSWREWGSAGACGLE